MELKDIEGLISVEREGKSEAVFDYFLLSYLGLHNLNYLAFRQFFSRIRSTSFLLLNFYLFLFVFFVTFDCNLLLLSFIYSCSLFSDNLFRHLMNVDANSSLIAFPVDKIFA